MTKIVGILNYTPDSYSDGGKHNTLMLAQERVEQLFAEGADLIDIGAEATSYGVKPLTAEQEWERLADLLPVLDPSKISIDTYHLETMRKVIDLGYMMINDVAGGKEDEVLQLIAANPHVKYVLMHSIVVPADKRFRVKKYEDIIDWAKASIQRCLDFGIQQEQLIFDPGLGFTTHPEQSLEVIRKVEELKQFGVATYVGHSRKSVFDSITNRPPAERDLETVIASAHMYGKVDYLRVHNVGWHRRAFDVCAQLVA